MFIEATGGRGLPPRMWDADEGVWSWDDDREAPGVDLEEALGLPGWDDPTEPAPEFYVDAFDNDNPWFADVEDELAVRRQVRALTPADIEGRAA